MWVSRREIARLERELKHALQRAENAEQALAGERQSKDWMITQLTSRFVTKQGGYGLDHEPPPKSVPDPRAFAHEPSAEDLARREYYIKCYRDAGRPEEEGIKLWEAEMRGETVTYPYEEAEREQ